MKKLAFVAAVMLVLGGWGTAEGTDDGIPVQFIQGTQARTFVVAEVPNAGDTFQASPFGKTKVRSVTWFYPPLDHGQVANVYLSR